MANLLIQFYLFEIVTNEGENLLLLLFVLFLLLLLLLVFVILLLRAEFY